MIARMNRKASHIGVVEVEVAEGGAIGEGRQIRCRAPIGADNGRVAADRERDVAANADRLLVEGADSTSDRVDHVDFDPFDGRGIDIVIAQAVGVGGKSLRKRTDGLLRRRRCRMALRARDPRRGRECRSAHCQMQKSSARELHGVSSVSNSQEFGTCPGRLLNSNR